MENKLWSLTTLKYHQTSFQMHPMLQSSRINSLWTEDAFLTGQCRLTVPALPPPIFPLFNHLHSRKSIPLSPDPHGCWDQYLLMLWHSNYHQRKNPLVPHKRLSTAVDTAHLAGIRSLICSGRVRASTREAKCTGHYGSGPISIKAPPLQQAVYLEIPNKISIFFKKSVREPLKVYILNNSTQNSSV